ncbi:MAG: metallophosphoesterase [Staphylothermus sp.]|nr:metallophosphoesterase [Staphylothermus sp.]
MNTVNIKNTYLRPLFKREKLLADELFIVPGTPLLYIKSENMIVFSDVHLGFEEAVARGLDYTVRGRSSGYAGMFIPRIQLKKTFNILEKVIKLLSPRKVLINGDLKHAFDRLLRQEKNEVKKLLDYLLEKNVREILIIRGNHDNYLPLVLKDYGLELHRMFELNIKGYNILFLHGHFDYDIKKYDVVIIGHEHPSLRCFEIYRFPVFLKIPTTNSSFLVLLPAISPYHPGTQISIMTDNYLSPLIKKYGIMEEAKPIIWLSYSDSENVDMPGLIRVSTELINIDDFLIDSEHVSIIEFTNIETALMICGELYF